MSIFTNFTKAQSLAWDWLRAFAEEDYTASQALGAYREAGGKIRTQDWYRLFSTYTEYKETWQAFETFGRNEVIPERFWLEVPRKFADKYIAEVEVAIRNNITGALQRTWRYIEKGSRMAQSEIDSALSDMGNDYIEAEQWHIEYIYGYKFYQKGQ